MEKFKAGVFINLGYHKSFKPSFINRKYIEEKINTLSSRAANAQKVINYLYQHPLIAASIVASVTGLTPASSYKLINDFIKLELLREITGGKRVKAFVFEKYLSLFYP